MENKRPSVIPTKEMIEKANQTGIEISKAYEKQIMSGDLPQSEIDMAQQNIEKIQHIKVSELHGGPNEDAAAAEMKRRTEEQMIMKKQGQPVTQSLFYEKNQPAQATVTSGHQASHTPESYKPVENVPEPKQTFDVYNPPVSKESQVGRVSYQEPDYTGPYDILELPSKGLIYPHKQGRIKVGFLTAADENILTSPNLLANGKFLEVLLDRKILTPGIRARDLHVGDRNALMIWLRSTGYGEKYPIEVNNPVTGELIETEIDLNILKIKSLNETPDEEGLFSYILPKSKKMVKFKLLTVGEEEEIEELVDKDIQEIGSYYSKGPTLTLQKQIIEIDGIRDEKIKNKMIMNLPIMDSMAFKKHVIDIESGIDLRISIEVPGGEPFDTFLPINTSFFWPDL